MIHAWVKALRLPYYPLTAVILLVGVSVSVYIGINHHFLIFWMVAANFFLHSACSLINEYTDFVTGADFADYPAMKWRATGGSKVLVDQLISPNHVLYISFLFFFISWGIWVFLAVAADYWLVLFVSTGVGITFLYAAAFSRVKFFYVREILLSFGAIPLFSVSVVKILSGVYSLAALTAGVITGMQILNYVMYHGLLDLKADAHSGKLRITRVLGEEKTVIVSEVLTGSTFFVLAASVYTQVLPYGCVLPFVAVPLAAKIMYAEIKRVAPSTVYTVVVLFCLLVTLLLSLGFWLS
jgi:1,4-dihydroxy-2-naphthoate octaprenyltransferase